MKKIKIKDVGEVVSGSTPKTNIEEFWNGNLCWITPAEISEDTYWINDTERKITNLAVEKTGLKLIPKGTVLLTSRAPIGKVAIANTEMYCNQGFKNIICSEMINNRFLYYYLKHSTEYLNSLGRGATFKEISKSIVEEIEIPFYDIKKQIQIANEFDKIQEVIEINIKQIELLKEFINSKFIEMFGNDKYERKCLNDISVIKGEYGSGASAGEYIEGQPRYVRITDIQDDGKLNNLSFASPKNEKNIEKYLLKYGDLLFARTGATVGKSYRYDENDGFCIYAGYCIRFRLDLKIANPNYIFIYTKTEEYRKWVENKQRVVAQPNINAKEYGNDLMIPIPPIELQNEFSIIIEKINNQIYNYEENLNKLKELRNSLMNKYFN